MFCAKSIDVGDLDLTFCHRAQKFMPNKEVCVLHTNEKKDRTNSITTSMRSDTDLNEEEETSKDNCAICLETFKDGDEISSSQNQNCRHVFHRECIYGWLLKNEECPCCRRDYLTFESVRDVEAGLMSVITSANNSGRLSDEQDGNHQEIPVPSESASDVEAGIPPVTTSASTTSIAAGQDINPQEIPVPFGSTYDVEAGLPSFITPSSSISIAAGQEATRQEICR